MKHSERIIHGITASAGVAVGRAVRAVDPLFISLNFKISAAQASQEVARLRKSIERSRKQLRRIQAELKRRRNPESSFLVDAHLLILEDPLFVGRIIDKIQTELINAEWAIQQVSDELFEAYDRLQDDYLRERRGDLEDIVRRILHNLRSRPAPAQKLPYDAIIVGRVIPPSMLFELRSSRIAGLVTETGSPMSHTAIMARSLEIPAVMGVASVSDIASGEAIIVDAGRGLVVCSPSEKTLEQYRGRAAERIRARPRPSAIASTPCTTQDGVRISLGANINFGEEAAAASTLGVEFIGLYRTEFDFFRDGREADEAKLLADYTRVLKSARNIPVTFRTIDVGIDQKSWDGVNSNLGVRGLRFCLENQDVFKAQLRALFRASARGQVRILLPFVSTVDDLEAAHEIIDEVRRDLARSREAHDPHVPIGVMIETPAAAQTCDLMADRVDFFCLGTNDLIQYYLVIDRSDQSVVHLHTPFHPAILRCLHQVYTLLEPTGKPVTVCGEVAADPPSAAVLLGLGFRALSVSLAAYRRIEHAIRLMEIGRLRELTGEILKMHKPKDVEEKVRAAIAAGAASL